MSMSTYCSTRSDGDEEKICTGQREAPLSGQQFIKGLIELDHIHDFTFNSLIHLTYIKGHSSMCNRSCSKSHILFW